MYKQILNLLNATNSDKAIVELYEVVGRLTLCIHWLRGTFNWLMYTGAVKFPTDADEANYKRLFDTIEIYEKTIWELVPSRAAVVGLRNLRINPAITLDELSKLFVQDAEGRIPFDLDVSELDDINDLLRRLGEARIAKIANLTHDGTTRKLQ